MAVVTKYGAAYPQSGALLQPNAIDAEGQVRTLYGKWSVANGDNSTSKYYLGRVPSNARILPHSTAYFSAITGLTDCDVGFANDPDALVDGGDLHTAGSKSLVAAVATGNLGKKAWEMAGLTSDPGGMLDIFATMNADASAAGTVEFFLHFAK